MPDTPSRSSSTTSPSRISTKRRSPRCGRR
jgi:hypothetical protein